MTAPTARNKTTGATNEKRSDIHLKEPKSGNRSSQENIPDWVKHFEERLNRIEQMVSDSSVNHDSDAAASAVARVERDIHDAQSAIGDLTKQMQGLAQEAESYHAIKEKVENLNGLAEYVRTKIKALQNQRVVVEKANEDAGKLNTLMWETDFRLKRITGKLTKLE